MIPELGSFSLVLALALASTGAGYPADRRRGAQRRATDGCGKAGSPRQFVFVVLAFACQIAGLC